MSALQGKTPVTSENIAMAPGILADHQIRDLALNEGMIEPFVEKQKREGNISFGLSSYGYDARCAPDFKIFTNVDLSLIHI